MSSRKQTPDVLGALLGGTAEPGDTPATVLSPAPPKRATATRKVVATVPDGGAISAGAPQLERPQWEYLEVVFRDYRGWRPMQANGRELGDWKSAPPIQDYLKQLGDAGWELVNMSERHHNQKEAYFKRLKR